MFRWLAGRGATRREVARELTFITSEVWQAAVGRHSFLAGLSVPENEALRQRAAWLLASKTFSGVHGLEVTDQIKLSIAIQAALPILELDTALYEGWTEIVLYPGGFLIPCSDIDESGVVHEYMQESSGEAWEGGPVILSWEDTDPGIARKANVVIHEFAHKLDLHTGSADGMPGLSAHAQLRPHEWRQVLEASFGYFNKALTAVEDAIPSHIDPESDEAAPWFDALPLDPYAATNVAEFFAVSSEAFFVNPVPLAKALPDLYGLLAQYYRQDPLRRLHAEPANEL
ncbi:MAG TPA: M90 family metallopeptidase [Eoetvoesiella sp.]